MKKLFVLLSPMVFTLFVACGGSEEPPPQALNSPAGPEGLKQVEDTAFRMKETCGKEYAPFVMQTAATLQFPQAAAPFQGAIQRPEAQNCNDQVMNFLMAYGTYYQGEAGNPGPQRYLVNQFKNIGDKWGQQLQASGIPITPSLVAGLVANGQGIGQDLMGKLQSTPLAPETRDLLSGQLGAALQYSGI
jgi:hypothetical protein